MRQPARVQGKVSVTAFELRRGVNSRVISSAAASSFVVQSHIVLAAQWTADGSLYYVDITHSKRSIAYIVQLVDNTTGEDLWAERINRTLDLDKCRIWLSETPTSITVLIV